MQVEEKKKEKQKDESKKSIDLFKSFDRKTINYLDIEKEFSILQIEMGRTAIKTFRRPIDIFPEYKEYLETLKHEGSKKSSPFIRQRTLMEPIWFNTLLQLLNLKDDAGEFIIDQNLIDERVWNLLDARYKKLIG